MNVVDILNKIKEGVLTQNWDLVCEAYQDITGEEIAPPATPMDVLQKMLDSKPKKKRKSKKVSPLPGQLPLPLT